MVHPNINCRISLNPSSNVCSAAEQMGVLMSTVFTVNDNYSEDSGFRILTVCSQILRRQWSHPVQEKCMFQQVLMVECSSLMK